MKPQSPNASHTGEHLAHRFYDGLDLNKPMPLPSDGTLECAAHWWSEEERGAVTLALAAGRPLLVRGEPGTGKTQLARALAEKLQAKLLPQVIHARYEAADIFYTVDTLQRLSDAQSKTLKPDWSDYLNRGPYWQACDLSNQQQQSVLLIDEIDKADSDVPNALLDMMANRRFTVTQTGAVIQPNPAFAPIVIFTTNEDRELPHAFVRRCVVLNQNPPDAQNDGKAFIDWLLARGRAHAYLSVAPDLMRRAAEMVLRDRLVACGQGYPPVGLAEYVDLLRGLHNLAPNNPSQQGEWFEKLAVYALVKNKDQTQDAERYKASSSPS